MRTSVLIASLIVTTSAFLPQPSFTRPTTCRPVAIDTSDIKNGLTVELDGEPYKVLNFSIMKQARGAAKTTIKFKNLLRGTTIENTYRSGEKFETALIEKKNAQFTYQEGVRICLVEIALELMHQVGAHFLPQNTFFFMESSTFEEIPVSSDIAEEKAKWISEGSEVTLVDFKGKIIEVVVPSTAVYEVVETEPNMKGNTAQGYTKPATLDSGAVISVPGFIEQGSKIKVDTDKGEYIERVN